jgi:lipopolysaccharide transport system ATP-binding protein
LIALGKLKAAIFVGLLGRWVMALIELNNVHLKYPLRTIKGGTLKDFFLTHILRRRGHDMVPSAQTPREVHALRGVTLRVENGERVGIIGSNGAGKTTLLRTMAGIYPISSGERTVTGSICSLLDIAVGFETDANGWDNIRYRGYLQEETPHTLATKYQEIAAFTELGTFMDLPIRYYSAGMTMRLAFAIATSSMPEILFVDEVFAAGDLAFRRKAEERMKDFMKQAKIVAMVGHDLPFLERFCQRVIWLDKGQVYMDGDPKEVVGRYKQEAAMRSAKAA